MKACAAKGICVMQNINTIKIWKNHKSALGPQGARNPKVSCACWVTLIRAPCFNQLKPEKREADVPRSAQHRLSIPLKGSTTWATEHPTVMKMLSLQFWGTKCLNFFIRTFLSIHVSGYIYLPVRFQGTCSLGQVLPYVSSKQQNPDSVLQSFNMALTSWRFKQLKTTGVVAAWQQA